VECGLKACILTRLAATPEVIFENRRFSESCWTHSISELVRQAGLESQQHQDAGANPELRRNWLIVKDWTENSRYQTASHQRAKKLYAAIAHQANGVMQWVRARW